MRRVLGSLTAAATAAVVLAGCGGSPQSEYCATVDAETALLTGPGGGDVPSTLASAERLQAAAPAELKDEWSTLVLALRELVRVLDEVGVDPADYAPGTRPDGVTEEQYKAVSGAASQLTSPRVLDASRGLEAYARDVCGVK